MFSPVPMRRLQAVVLTRDERAVLHGLGRLNAVHLARAEADVTLPQPPDLREAIARCDHLSARVNELAIPYLAGHSAVLCLEDAEDSLSQWETRIADLRRRLRIAAQRRDEAVETSERVAPYQGLGLPPDQLSAIEFLHFATGSLPTRNLATLQAAIGDDVALWILAARGDRQPIVAVCAQDQWSTLEAALLQTSFQAEARSPVPASQLEQTQNELAQLDAAWQSQSVEAAPVLAAVEQAVQTERRLLEAEQQCPRTAAAVLITGWVPAAESGAVESQLREVSGGRCVVQWGEADAMPEAEVPVLLHPPRWFRPFTVLVEAFGLPRYREVEPTVFMAFSYLLMFGMMFGDVGHGALLALAGWLMSRTGRRVGLLLVFAGIASGGFGVVYGSYFGITSLKRYALWRDPVEGDPLALMLLAVGIGVVMISLGQVLNIMNHFRRGDIVNVLLDKFGVVGVVFYWGSLALVTKYAAFEARGLVRWAVLLFVAVLRASTINAGLLSTIIEGQAVG